MTVSSSISKNQYVSTGGTGYEYTFRIFRDEDLDVYVTDPVVGADVLLALGSDYTVTGAGDENGGRVELAVGPPSGLLVTIIRSVPFVQEVDLVDNDPFHAETVEGALDRLTMLVQQLQEAAGRTVRLSATTMVSQDRLRLPEPSPRRAIGWDASGALGNLADLNGTTVSPFMETVLDDGDAAEVRADIGAESAGAAAAHAAADAAHSAEKIVYDHSSSGLTADRVQGAIDEAAALAKAVVPAGACIWWPGQTLPDGWLIRNGAAVSRTTYAALFAAIGTRYGVGNGSTTFNLPDDRGRFIRGQNLGSGFDPDAASRTNSGGGYIGDNVGTQQGSMYASHSHTLGGYTGGYYGAPNTSLVMTNLGGATSTTAAGGNETRPVNRAYLPIIKY